MASQSIFGLIVIFLIISIVNCENIKIDENNKRTVKRSFNFNGGFIPFDLSGGGGHGGPWASFRPLPPSPSEITAAIASAKQASANVLIAQQQVQSEKENVLQQQKIANEKEHYANIAKQKNEVFAAVQRSEAAAAAQAVVLAQQRLAAAKQAVAHQQRVAAQKEAHAASALQSAAHAAAAEIQKSENLASKLENSHRIDNAALVHHVAATKDAIVGPLSNGGNHALNLQKLFVPAPIAPWNSMPSGSAWIQPQSNNFHPWN